MKLASMQFKDFIWPHNPRVYCVDYKRELALHKLPRGRYHLQNLGLTRRVFEGEGAFIGETAYSEFKKLASLFYDETPGVLVHPLWQSARVYFRELSLRQEPRADFVAYRFVFWECGEYEGAASLSPYTETPNAGGGGSGNGSGGAASAAQELRYYTVRRGDTLWGIARAGGFAAADIGAESADTKPEPYSGWRAGEIGVTEFILQTPAGVDYRLAPALAFSLSYGLGTPCDGFSVTCPWVAGQEEILGGLVRLRALRGGAVMFTGVIDEWVCSLSDRGYLLTITGRGMQARLLDNEALSADFGVATLADIMRTYVTPYDIALTQGGNLPAVRGFSVKAGSSCWQVLYDFARYHGGVLPRFDLRGGLSLAPLPSSVSRVLGDQLPVTALNLRHTRYGVFSQVQVQNRTTRRVESVRNAGFSAEGGSATRVLTVPRNTQLQSMRHSAQFQLAQSQRRRVCVEMTLPQVLLLAPGDLVQLRRAGFGANGSYRVLEVTLSFGAQGYETDLLLGDARYAM